MFNKEITEYIHSIFRDMLDKNFEQTFHKGFDACTSTNKEAQEDALTADMLLETLEKLKPEYAILINEYTPPDGCFEFPIEDMQNAAGGKSKFYCKKLLIMTSKQYHKLSKLDIGISRLRVYGDLKTDGDDLYDRLIGR